MRDVLSYNRDLFETPVKSVEVTHYKKTIAVAHLYRNGVINIDGRKYSGYSLMQAIKLFKQQNREK